MVCVQSFLRLDIFSLWKKLCGLSVCAQRRQQKGKTICRLVEKLVGSHRSVTSIEIQVLTNLRWRDKRERGGEEVGTEQESCLQRGPVTQRLTAPFHCRATLKPGILPQPLGLPNAQKQRCCLAPCLTTCAHTDTHTHEWTNFHFHGEETHTLGENVFFPCIRTWLDLWIH